MSLIKKLVNTLLTQTFIQNAVGFFIFHIFNFLSFLFFTTDPKLKKIKNSISFRMKVSVKIVFNGFLVKRIISAEKIQEYQNFKS